MWKDSIRNIVVIFQTTILRIVGSYVRHSAIVKPLTTYHATLLKFHTSPQDFFRQDRQWLMNPCKYRQLLPQCQNCQNQALIDKFLEKKYIKYLYMQEFSNLELLPLSQTRSTLTRGGPLLCSVCNINIIKLDPLFVSCLLMNSRDRKNVQKGSPPLGFI